MIDYYLRLLSKVELCAPEVKDGLRASLAAQIRALDARLDASSVQRCAAG
jgi:hypothetical protein